MSLHIVLDKGDYQKKLQSLFDYRTKVSLLNDDPVKNTLKRENKVRSFLRDLKKSGALTEKQYHDLSTTGSCPGTVEPRHTPTSLLGLLLSRRNGHPFSYKKTPLIRPPH